MKIAEALSSAGYMYVDAAPFIYYTELRSGYAEKMIAILEFAVANGIRMMTSTLTLAECFAKPVRERNQAVVDAYETMFSQSRDVTLVPVNRLIARRAADFRATYNLRTPDAIHVATATLNDCDVFLTNDLALRRVTQVRVHAIDELELEA